MFREKHPNQKFKVNPLPPPANKAKTSELSTDNVLPRHYKRANRKPPMYSSPFKAGKSRTVPVVDHAMQLRDLLCSPGSPLKSHYLIQFLPFAWTGSDIADSFSDGRMTDIFFLEYFVKCLAEDDKLHRAESYGYRIFMPPRVCCALNPEELNKGNDRVFDPTALDNMVRENLPPTDWSKAKLVFLSMCHREHISVYCINFRHTRIDVLDSLDYKSIGTEWEQHHDKEFCDTMMQRLSDSFQRISKKDFKVFANMRRVPFTEAPVMVNRNDCAFFSMKFIEFFDGEESSLRTSIAPEKSGELRSEMLHYLLFHTLNDIKDMPPEIERFRLSGVPF
ncbi:uncharacterized protein LOC133914479 [Phragmites australis]|uniref:uncharacterized protein LOC133914479 n=3 Tax=Phragmites australis TaxID=29695 RepID=UPI002D77560F|nr:uncharacterized protein LOC133914479 [Phragmites australis]